MENFKEIRWQQRYMNFEKAFANLEEAVTNIENLDKLSKEGLIQRFEYTLELAWKTLKDYLEFKGTIAKFPKEVIKQSFQTDILDDGEIWMNMLEDRNLMSHTYDENNFNIAIENICRLYYPQLKKINLFLKNEK